MPIFYNQSVPTPSTKNTINTISINYGVRDFLLNLNLLPIYPQLSTNINGAPRIGEPVLDTLVNNGSNVIPIGLPLDTNGILWKDMIIGINTFQNSSPLSNSLTDITLVNTIPNSDFPNTDWPQGIQTYPTTANVEVSQYGLMGKTSEANFRKKNTIKNLYLDVSKQIDMGDFITLTPLNISQQVTGYLDTYGSLNLGGNAGIQAANVIGSVLNGQGLGLAKGGIVTNFDIRSSLAGRILGATGLINDTKLGMIGGQQLALSLANNAAFNVEQDLLGSFNVQNNILSLIKGDGLAGLRPSYKITIPKNGDGRIMDSTSKILGFTIPISYLDDAGSIFQPENGRIANIERANNMILNTGKGQIQALLTNVRANQYGTVAGGSDDPSNTAFRSGYAPAYTNNKGQVQITDGILYAFSKQGKIIDLFGQDGFSNVSTISYNREEMVKNSGFESPQDLFLEQYNSDGGNNIKRPTFSWGSNEGGNVNSLDSYSPFIGDKKSLLTKTQTLFNDKGMLNIVTRKGDMNKHSTQIQTANGGGFSKGNAVLQKHLFDLDTGRLSKASDTPENTYCRSWTTLDRYDQVSKLVRSHGLWDRNNVPFREHTENSVLDDYGFVKIAPYITDKATDPKKYMFSIENLAWADDIGNLPQCEVGPGDLVTGKQGRIMWFPPYDISISENSNVNWDANNFIGRGESVYTYNNTERSGNISFKVVVDHPSYANSFSSRFGGGPDDHFVNSFWAGCIDPDSKWGEKLTVSERSELVSTDLTVPQQKNIPHECEPGDLTVYFPNDNSEIYKPYENGLITGTTTPIDYSVNQLGAGEGLGTYKADFTPGNHNNSKKADGEGWPDRYNYGLNYSQSGPNGSRETPLTVVGANDDVLRGYFDPNTDAYIIKHLTEICPHCVATITGYASEQGKLVYNTDLAISRANKIKEDIKKKWWPSIKAALPKLTESDFDKRFIIGETKQLTNTGCKKCDGIPLKQRDKKCPTDTLQCKKDRRATISFKFNPDLAGKDIAQPEPVVKKIKKNVTTRIKNKYYTECNYFEQLTDKDPFIFDSFREKIRYFHPAFHSTTPEGLNSRLTFLLQCTRQGKTVEDQGANNLAFGRAPVCILRIGDFYNTKIVIDNISIDYEPLVWDLNPEGIGVQPMIASVTMSFKFIGASSLMGPINKLQNALSFNYFANTQVYDARADYIAKEEYMSKMDINGNEVPVYNLVNGEKDISNLDIKITPTDVIDNTPAIDQIKSNEQAVSIQNQKIETEYTDDEIISFFKFVKISENFNVKNVEDFVMGYYMVWDCPDKNKNLVLTKPKSGILYVENSKNNEQIAVGFIELIPNGENIIFKTYGSNKGVKNLDWDSDWEINGEYLFHGVKWYFRNTFLYDKDKIGSDLLTKLYDENSGYLKIVWENNNKISTLFGSNNTK